MSARRDPWLVAFPALAVLTRVPLIPRTLYDFDAAAFAEALQSFDPIRFHPHPPGYTFYVLATKAIHALGVDASRALAFASVGASALTVAALYTFGRSMAGRRAGCIAALFYLCSPLAWTYGVVQGTYGFGALGATLVAFAAWRRLEGVGVRPAYLGFGAATAAGFRPDTAVVLAPLLLMSCALAPQTVGIRARLRSVAEALVTGLLGLALWIAPAASASGSWSGYLAAVHRQWEAVSFSNAESHFTWLLFRAVNAVKLAVYSSFALGPLGSVLLLIGLARVWRADEVSPASKATLFAWIAGYAALTVGVAFGQPGMLLTTLPAACLVVGVAFGSSRAEGTTKAGRSLPILAAALSALVFWAAPGLGDRGFFDSQASLPTKLATELRLFTRPGIRLVDRRLGDAFDTIRRRFPPGESVVLTNVASSTRAMWALPEYRVACYFAFAGFGAPIPSHDLGEPRGTWSLPGNARWLVLLDADRHSISIADHLSGRVVTSSLDANPARASTREVLQVFALGGASAIRFHSGRIEAVGGGGLRGVDLR